MTTRNTTLTVRPALGGLDITSDATILDPNYLVTADNVTYLEGGQRKRRPGFLQYSTSSSMAGTFTNALISTATRVRAISDTWDYSTGIPPVQRLTAAAGFSVWRSTGNGLWSIVGTSSAFAAGTRALPTNIMLGQNHAVFSDGVSPPLAYNLAATTIVYPTTGANWPVFQSAVFHQTRMVMLGLQFVSTSTGAPFTLTPSDISVTAAGNIFDSTGTDSVRLPIDPGDGDQVIGCSQTFFRNLYVFKGPQYGSVHEISGNTSTNYVKSRITSGAPAASHLGIITTPTDIYWISKYGVHSLQTTLKFGDVEQGFLSLPIQNLWRKKLINLPDLANAKGFWDPNRNIVGWAVTPANVASAITDPQNYRSWLIVYNYALSDPTPGGRKFWSIWKLSRQTGANMGIWSMAMILNSTGTNSQGAAHGGEPHLYFGADNGLVYQTYPFFDDDGAAYATQITTPIITKFKTDQGVLPETSEKQFTGIVSYYTVPDTQTLSGMTYTVQVDNRDAGTGALTGWQQGGVLGTFILGSGILGGISMIFEESIIEGRGRSIQITWANSQLDQDFEHIGYSVRCALAEGEPKEPS